MIAAILCALVVVWGMPIVASALGWWGQATFLAVSFLVVVWFLYFGVGSLLIACPQCGRSVFVRGFGLSAPWPARQCGKCGRDLTAP